MPYLGKQLVEVKFDERELRRYERMLRGIPNGMKKAMSRAINKTAMKAKGRMARLVRNETSLKLKDVRKAIKIDRATWSKWLATIHAGSRRVPLYKFGGRTGPKKNISIETTGRQAGWLFAKIFRQEYGDDAILAKQYTLKRKGYPNASYEIEKGKRKTIPDGAFVATMPRSGHVGFFKAHPSGIKRSIIELMGPSIGGLIEEPERLNIIKRKTFEDLIKEARTQVNVLIAQSKKA